MHNKLYHFRQDISVRKFVSRNSLQHVRKPRAVISQEEALSLITEKAPSVLILEVVSDYYADLKAIEHRQTHPIPGFFQISSDRLEEAPMWNLRQDETMIKVLEEYGIMPDSETLILLFDNIQIECGFAESRFDASARIYSVLKYFGVEDVAIIMDDELNSHFPDEYAASHPEIVRRMAESVSEPLTGWSDYMLARAPLDNGVFVSYETLVDFIVGDLGPYRLLDARSAEEHAGDFTGYDYIPVAGRIPTSESIVNGDYQLTEDESLTNVLSRLEDTLKSKGISKTDRLIWYCGTGWRAARMFVLSHALGYKNVGIYEGGWNEWYQRNLE